MDITIKGADLARDMAPLHAIASRKVTIPVLANVLVEASPLEGLRLSATDLDVTIRTTCPASIGAAGKVLINAKRLYEMAKLFPSGSEASVRRDKTGVAVKAGAYSSRLLFMPDDEYPMLPDPGDAPGAPLNAPALLAMIRQVQFAISETSAKVQYFTNGGHLELTDGRMKMVATDSYRLCISSAPRDAGVDVKTLVPRRLLHELRQMLEGAKAAVTFTLGDSHMFFSSDTCQLSGRLVDGQFPAYERIVPKGHDKQVTVNRAALLDAVRRVALVANETTRAVKMTVAPAGVTVTASNHDVGEAEEHVEARYTQAPVTTSLKSEYLLDFLDAASGADVSIELKSEADPVLLRQADETVTSYLCVIMPIRT